MMMSLQKKFEERNIAFNARDARCRCMPHTVHLAAMKVRFIVLICTVYTNDIVTWCYWSIAWYICHTWQCIISGEFHQLGHYWHRVRWFWLTWWSWSSKRGWGWGWGWRYSTWWYTTSSICYWKGIFVFELLNSLIWPCLSWERLFEQFAPALSAGRHGWSKYSSLLRIMKKFVKK